MKVLFYQLVVLVVLFLNTIFADNNFKLEAELYGLAKTEHIQSRTLASNGQTLQMTDQSALLYEICIDTPIEFQITNLRYLNNGDNNTINIYIQDQIAWSFITSSTNHSDTFISSGPLGNSVLLMEGRYVLSIEFSTPASSGLELDFFEVSSSEDSFPLGLNCTIKERTVKLEIEDFVGYETFTATRSQASRKQSVVMFEGQKVSYYMCSISEVNVTLKEVIYSNDGNSDTVTISIDNNVVGSFNTADISNGGLEWNTFRTSGQIGNTITLTPGKHMVEIKVTSADTYGVELDNILISYSISSAIFENMQCSSDVKLQLEAEDFITSNGQNMSRTDASGLISVSLKAGESIHKDVCFRQEVNLSFDRILYSNDGGSDIVILTLDSFAIGLFITEEANNFGNEWNNFRIANIPSTPIHIPPGRHTLGMEISHADSYGTEIDMSELTLNFGDNGVTSYSCSEQQSLILEAENFQNGSNQGIMYRSNAFSGKTVNLTQGDFLRQALCVTGRVKIALKNVRLSNDGDSDVITIRFQSIAFPPISTHGNFSQGHSWNDIQVMGINRSIFAQTGQYELSIEATYTDQYGVEIDALTIDVTTADSGKVILC